MKRILAFGLAATLAVAAFLWGLNHGINVGVEETTRFYQDMAPVCAPATPIDAPVPVG